MKKILICTLMVACLILCSGNVKATTFVEVSTMEQLKENIALGNNVKLMDNISTTTEVLTIDKSLTMDLNGYEYAGSEPSNINKTVVITGTSTVATVEDNSALKQGKIVGQDAGTQPRIISLEDGAKLILNSGTISNEKAQVPGSMVYQSANTNFVMNGGTVKRFGTTNFAIAVNVKGNNSKFTLNNGSIVCEKGNGVSISNAIVEINNGKITSAGREAVSGAYSSTQQLIINGGTFESPVGSVTQGSGSTLTITGGTFTNKVTTNGTANISGGLFNGDTLVKSTSKVTTITSGTFKGKFEVIKPAKLIISGGSYQGDFVSTSEGKIDITGGEYKTNISDKILDTTNNILVLENEMYHLKHPVYIANNNSRIRARVSNLTISSQKAGHEVQIDYTAPSNASSVTYNVWKTGEEFVKIPVTDSKFVMPRHSVTVHAEPFFDKVIESENKNIGVKLNGNLTENATLKVDKLEKDSAVYTEIINNINQKSPNVLGSFEVKIENGSNNGKMKLTFDVGKKYNGMNVKVYHKKDDGNIEEYKVVVKDGKVSVTVNSLSPFIIVMDEKDSTPKTGNCILKEIVNFISNIFC